MIYDTQLIEKAFSDKMNRQALAVTRFENVPNNTVYRVEALTGSYIFKIYTSNWPEEGKLPFVIKKLSEHGIPHAKLCYYERSGDYFPHGFLIEECLEGATADRLSISVEENIEIYKKLGRLVSDIHRIKLDGFGYLGSGKAEWGSFSQFMADSLWDNNEKLLSSGLTDKTEMEYIETEIKKRLECCDNYPAVLCHTDLSAKNIMVHRDTVKLIDWDDAYSLCYAADIAALTLWMRYNCGEYAEAYRKAFLEAYDNENSLDDFYKTEDILHMRYGLDLLNYFIDTPAFDILKPFVRESSEKCGMKILKFLY